MTARISYSRVLLVVACLCTPINSWSDITIRLSYKIITDASGTWPTGVTANKIGSAIDSMNELLSSYGRGYRFALAGPVTPIGGSGDANSPSKWFAVDLRTDTVPHPFPAGLPPNTKMSALSALEIEAKSGGSPYGWSSRSINIYINQGSSGGRCSIPAEFLFQSTSDIIGIGPFVDAGLHLHEIGHFFGLKHTHEKGGFLGLGEEGIDDTVKDDSKWTRDDIATQNFGSPFASLSSTQQEAVLNVWDNVMSYHASHSTARTRLTELQLDRWSNISNNSRRSSSNGMTVYVHSGANIAAPSGIVSGFTSYWPVSLSNAIDLSNKLGNRQVVLLLKKGSYSNKLEKLHAGTTLRTRRPHTVSISD